MARLHIFFSTIRILSVLGSVACSGSSALPTASDAFPADIGTGQPAMQAPVFKDIRPYSRRLPFPPVPFGPEEPFTGELVLNRRNHDQIVGFNKPRAFPLTNISHSGFEAVPPGMRTAWVVIRNELEWFGAVPAERDILLELFQIIFEDDYSKFCAFELKFADIFRVYYRNFSKNGRSVIGWLIAFGSANILSSIEDLNLYKVNEVMVEVSLRHLVNAHPLHHVALMIDLNPFLSTGIVSQDKNLFKIVSQRSGSTPFENIAVLLSKMRNIKMVHLVFISFITSVGQNDTQNLINFCFQVNQSILYNPSSNINQEDRSIQSQKFKNALQQFLDVCVIDFKDIVDDPTIFQLAHLFMEFRNLKGLVKVIDSQPRIISALSNGKTLLQTAIDLNCFDCAVHLARSFPASIFKAVNATQSPFLQSIIVNNMQYFQVFVQYIEKDTIIPLLVDSKPIYFYPQSMAIIFDRPEMLRNIVAKVIELGGIVGLRDALDVAINFKIEDYRKTARVGSETPILISPEIWNFLLTEDVGFNFGIHRGRRLIDLAILDKNVEVARRITERQGFQINEVVESEDNTTGNCSWLIKNDIEMLKLLLSKGLNINDFISRPNFFVKTTIETVPILIYLLENPTPEFFKFVSELPEITLETAKAVLATARAKSYNDICIFFSGLVKKLEPTPI